MTPINYATKQIIKPILCFLFFLFLFSCSDKQKLQDGDLLFVAADTGNLSEAINRVTQTELETNYSHVAIIEIKSDTIWVWESEPKQGTRKILLNDFIREQETEIFHYRLKKEYAKNIEKAWSLAETMKGKPYNFSYKLNDTSYYCSEFIYRLFAQDAIFELNPMTFINPETNNFDESWIKHYERLEIEIPEGEFGCNPNGLAASSKLDYIGKFNFNNIK